MKDIISEHPFSRPVLEEGQIWELDGSHIRIGIVGKRLVHYKHFGEKAKRANNSLTSIDVLQQYLSEHKAVLQSKQDRSDPPGALRMAKRKLAISSNGAKDTA